MKQITIPGPPPKTTAQMTRWRCAKVGGRMMPIAYKSKEQKAAIKHFADGIPQQIPIDGPVKVAITFVWPWRKSEPKTVTDKHSFKWKDTRPDCDNLAKEVLDQMTASGCWHDDGQICSLIIEKVWSTDPEILIEWGPI